MSVARILIASTLLLSAARHASAQAPAPPTGPSAAGPGAAAPGAAPGDPAVSSESEAALAARASEAFRRGDERFATGEFEGALAEYSRAYELLADYKVLYNIGSANVRLRRWAGARRAFALYLQLGEGQLTSERVDEVRGYLEVLRRNTATLTLMLTVPDAEVHIDGVRVGPTEISGVYIDPGTHVVSVSKAGFRPLEHVLEAPKGENLSVLLPLAPAGLPSAVVPAPRTLRSLSVPDRAVVDEPTPLWVPWAVTGALGAGWLTTAGLAIKARHDRDIIERPGTSAERIDAARRLHITLAVVSDVLLAATLASAGVSAYVTWWPGESERSASAGGGAQRALDGIGAGVSGRF